MDKFLNELKYDANGFVTVIVQDNKTDEILMCAFANKEAILKTIETGLAHFYSRSRKKLWMKGEESGNTIKVLNISIDCDGDALIYKGVPSGAVCHTGHLSCFFRKFEIDELKKSATKNALDAKTDEKYADETKNETNSSLNETGSVSENESQLGNTDQNSTIKEKIENEIISSTEADLSNILFSLKKTIRDRKLNPKEGSYTNYLFTKGIDKILKKISEESGETIIAIKNNDKNEIVYEVCDLIYHILVALELKEIEFDEILTELKNRIK